MIFVLVVGWDLFLETNRNDLGELGYNNVGPAPTNIPGCFHHSILLNLSGWKLLRLLGLEWRRKRSLESNTSHPLVKKNHPALSPSKENKHQVGEGLSIDESHVSDFGDRAIVIVHGEDILKL